MATITKHILTICGILCINLGMGQNLINDPSFEVYTDCPKRLGNFNVDLEHWSAPTIGSTDYFNACSTIMGIPDNFNGSQQAKFGNGYAGFYMYAPNDYREYIQAEILETLKKGTTYHLSFYVNLAEESDFAIRDFGVLFTEKQIVLPIKKYLSKLQLSRIKDHKIHFLEIERSNFFTDKNDWVMVSTELVANGTENFMTIGNFENNARTKWIKTKKNAKKGAYYYVDMVSLTKKYSNSIDTNPDKEGYELGITHVFENVLFGFDEFQLLETAKKGIEGLYTYLKSDASLHIAINGYTDNMGTPTYNQLLSNKRAREVAMYLIHLGLPKDRITWQGFGDNRPVADNTTEEGRQKNRRVEFIITQAGN